MNLMTFDMASVPDVDFGRRLYNLDDLDDADVVRVMYHRHRQQNGEARDLPAHQQRLVALSMIRRHGDGIEIESLDASGHEERTMLQAFFHQLERGMPALALWNRGGSHLPLLHYRALVHGVACARYWDWVEAETGRRRDRHEVVPLEAPLQLKEVLAGPEGEDGAPLHEVALLLGLPGEPPLESAQIWEHFVSGDLAVVRQSCDVGALTTYLVYLRFELARGQLSPERHGSEIQRLCERLSASGQDHLGALAEALAAL